MESFAVTNLDISDVTEDMLKEKAPRINQPGKYTMRITGHKMGVGEKVDGAGKKWGWVSVNTEDVESGRSFNIFLSVPIETLKYTSAAGKTSLIKTQIFKNFLKAIGVADLSIGSLMSHVNNLGSLLDGAPAFSATLNYRGDHVSYIGKTEEGEKSYGITLKDGSALLDADGAEVVTFSSYNAAVDYYKQINKNKEPSSLEATSFSAV